MSVESSAQVPSEASGWQKTNADYLAAALEWLRLRLARRAADLEAAHESSTPSLVQATPPGPAPAASRAHGFFRRREPEPARLLLNPAPSRRSGQGVSDADLASAAAAVEAALEGDPPPALRLLSRRFGLLRFEEEILLLCAAVELDTRVAALCARAQDDPARPFPTFALALSLFEEPSWDALSPERPLRYWRLLEISQPGAQPLTTSPLRADERIVNYLKGLNYLDDRLAPLLAPAAPSGAPGATEAALPPSHQALLEAMAREVAQAREAGTAAILQLAGPDSSSKRLLAIKAAADAGLNLLRLPASALPAGSADLEALARLWQREAILLPIALYLDAHDVDKRAESSAPPLLRFVSRLDGLVFLAARETWPAVGRPTAAFDVTHPTAAEQRNAWEEAFGRPVVPEAAERIARLAERLAAQFSLGISEIRSIAEGGPEQAWGASLAATRPRLSALAQRLEPRATWDDIVLPENESRLLRQIADQAAHRSTVYDAWGFRKRMNRGLGISVLFAGESGTGKTMAAEVLANHLELSLYRIDLSAVVSKYIGETEKNLCRLFDAAEDGGAILFFDEADALFGKRSEVKDSHDRYANIEINYVLQRMEAYQNLAILATNMKGALDSAFVRRLRFIVTFNFPGTKERREMWRKAFPPETPLGPLDWDRLARWNLTGGNIHNIALASAFLAARAGATVTMPLVLEAARTEFRKLEKPVNEADFRWIEPVEAAS